jgi:predicted O-methyltransferase YrrM
MLRLYLGIRAIAARLDQLASSMPGLVRQVSGLANSVSEIRTHAKYATDLLLSPPGDDNASLERETWSYGLNRQDTVRRQVAFARALEESRIRELYLQEIFPDIEAVDLPIGAINELSGHPNKVDLLYVCAVARQRKAQKIFEFGTYQGRTTYHLTFASDTTEVTTIDMPPRPDWGYAKYSGSYFRNKPQAGRIRQIYEDSRTFDTSPMRVEFDMVFVDADHSYEGVKNDTVKAFELLKPGGVIMWHDYAPKSPGLVRFFTEFTRERPLFRIKRTCLLLHIDNVDPMTFTPLPMIPSLELDHEDKDPHNVANVYHH